MNYYFPLKEYYNIEILNNGMTCYSYIYFENGYNEDILHEFDINDIKYPLPEMIFSMLINNFDKHI